MSRYISKLWRACRAKGIKLRFMGLTGEHDEHLLVKIVLNKTAKKAVCFSAGIHGDEHSGPWGIIEFIKRYEPKRGDPAIIILPLLNPPGFEKKTYKDHRKIDLNLGFADHIEHESIEVIYETIKKYSIKFFAAFHEDDVMDGCYLYAYSHHDLSVFRKIINFMGTKWKICKRKKIYEDEADNGIIYCKEKDSTFEGKMFTDGVKYTTCLEYPDCIPFKQRVSFVADTMFYIIDLVKKMRI